MNKSIIALSILASLTVTAKELPPQKMEVKPQIQVKSQPSTIQKNDSMFLNKRIEKPLVLPDVLNPDVKDEKPVFDRQGPTIQLAILLDTSGSMNGLINQARLKIWDIVNEISKANKDNKDVRLEVALYEYGSATATKENGYINRLNGLTGDLDLLSENLFNLKTTGSEEFSGEAIERATEELVWSDNKNDLKLIIVAGNESFSQGYIPYEHSVPKATGNDIIVNTIFCGDYREGLELEWKKAADLGQGKYLVINQNTKIEQIKTPYDQKINDLGRELNKTYIKYGKQGAEKAARQKRQDTISESVSSSYMASRNLAKSTESYDTESWDLVDNYKKNGAAAITMAKETNSEMSKLSEDEIKKNLESKLLKRKEIKSSMKKLEKQRKSYIERSTDDFSSDLGFIMVDAIKKQAKERGYTFDK